MRMRGSDAASGSLFSYVDMEERVQATHPLRTIRTIVNEVLAALDTEFEALYEGTGRLGCAGAAAARLTVAGVLLCPFRAAADGADHYNLLFRWFVGLGIDDAIDDAVWDHSTFSKNR